MISQNDILKIAKHTFRRGQGIPDKKLMHPHRDWGLGVVVFAVLLLCGSYYAAVVFTQYRDINIEGGVSSERIPRYQADQISKTISIYENKEATFNALVGEVVEVSEVSIASSTATSTTQSASSTTAVQENLLIEDEEVGAEDNASTTAHVVAE